MEKELELLLNNYIGYTPEELHLKNYDEVKFELIRKIEALILPVVSRSISKKKQEVYKVFTRDENDKTGVCTLCKYKGQCDKITYHKCIIELNKGEYYG